MRPPRGEVDRRRWRGKRKKKQVRGLKIAPKRGQNFGLGGFWGHRRGRFEKGAQKGGGGELLHNPLPVEPKMNPTLIKKTSDKIARKR